MAALSPQADQWYQLLEGRWVTSGDQTWVLSVESVYVDGEDVWIQLLRWPREAHVIVHVRPPATIRDVLTELQVSLAQGLARIDVPYAA